MIQFFPPASYQRRLSVFVAALFVFGSCGFVVIEGWSFLDSIYMTLITLSTVGFGEAEPLTPTGRAYTSLLVTISLVSMACWTAGLTSTMLSGELSGRFQKLRELKMISAMSDHTIVCGSGLTATTIVQRLHGEGQAVVVIANDATEIDMIRRVAPGVPVIIDDPKSELAMADANILDARHLVAALESDYDNLLIAITGKGMGTGIRVISCAQSNELASRMIKVGADDVICPQIIGGEHVVGLIGDSNDDAV